MAPDVVQDGAPDAAPDTVLDAVFKVVHVLFRGSLKKKGPFTGPSVVVLVFV
jgi:hypothetical protein